MSVYTGSNNGFMQATYVDQQGTALPGDLAYASDVDLIDACVVSMPAGSEGDLLPVGVGVVGAYSAHGPRRRPHLGDGRERGYGEYCGPSRRQGYHVPRFARRFVRGH